MNKADIKARIAATAHPKPRLCKDVPEWGEFYIRPAVVGDIDDAGPDVDQRTRVATGVANSVCDENGELVFDRKNADDMAVLLGLPNSLIAKLSRAIDGSTVNTTERAQELGNDSPPETASSST